MPTIDELSSKSKKKFQKSEYRPWNYMDILDKESNSTHIDINCEPNKNQLDIVDIVNKPVDPPHLPVIDINCESNSDQLEIKKESTSLELENPDSWIDIIFRLSGHQKKIFLLVVERCLSRGTLTTGVINSECLAEITDTSFNMIKTSIQRLEKKQLIIRERGKRGRGGFYSFRLTEVVRNAAIDFNRMLGIQNLMVIKKESSSNQLDINKMSNKKTLPMEWANIQILPLEEIGFNSNHLLDIYETGFAEPEIVQESIFHFAYGLEHEPAKYKQYDDPLKVLIGKLRKGGNWYEKNYRSQKEIAQLELLERKRTENERIKKMEEEAYTLACNEWLENLSVKEDKEILEKYKKDNKTDLTPKKVILSKFFKENIWANIKSDYLIE